MGRLRSSEFRSGRIRNRFARSLAGFTAILLLAGAAARGKSPAPQNQLTLEGSVRDSSGRPVAGAAVYLQAQGVPESLVTETRPDGTFHFSDLRSGVYSIHAEKAGWGEAAKGEIQVQQENVAGVGLVLKAPGANPLSLQPAAPQESSPKGKFEFFDEPEFTVAGVTESTTPGGHGSDAILRTSESLAQQTLSLKNEPSAGTTAAAPDAASMESLRQAARRAPASFDANRRLGEFLLRAGKFQEALPYLQRAYQIEPGHYANAYDLAWAFTKSSAYTEARDEIRAVLAHQDKAELHNLLGEVEERLGNPLAAVGEYKRAADLDPSEKNLFDWGSELLLHRAVEPAIEVFTEGNKLYPRSSRMLMGLGVAWYARGYYDQAARRLGEASDLNPQDPGPYLFLGKMQSATTLRTEGVAEKLQRFAGLYPQNALAHYYYAVSLWKLRKGQDDGSLNQVESLLERAVQLDPNLAEAYLQLGILYADRKQSEKAIAAYQKAIELAPNLEEAHYRLALAYTRAGDKLKAQKEFRVYDRVAKEKAAEVERQRREIQQFVYSSKGQSSNPPPQ